MPPVLARKAFRFILPSSLSEAARVHAETLRSWLEKTLAVPVEVGVAPDYRNLSSEVLAGRADAAWAPPYMCAQLEAMGARVLARVVRAGASSYRSALICRKGEPLTLASLAGKRAAWVDRNSVGGYLLPLAFLKSKGMDPEQVFFEQRFAGTYALAVEAVLRKEADVASVFAPPGEAQTGPTGLEEIVPGKRSQCAVVAYTEESPNDGVALSMSIAPPALDALEKGLLSMQRSLDGRELLKSLFHADRFELAPRLSYRALYRVATNT